MALKEGCYNRIAERNGRIYLFQHEAPLAEGLNPLVFPDIHEYKRFVEQQLMSGGECRVLRVRKTKQRHPEEKQEEKRDIKILEAPSADNTKEGEPNWSTTRDFGQAWNPDTLREFNDYEWNRLNGTGVGAGSAKKGEAPGITAANLKDGVLGEGKYTPAEKYAMRDVKLNIGNDALIPEGSLRETRVPETRATEVRKMLAKTATGGVVQRPPPPPFDPRFEMSGDEMKRMYLSEHPEYHDVEMVRTGVNQQEVVGITPRVEGEGGSGMIGNRGMEEEVAKEDLRSMGGSVMDPNRSGIEYLRADRRAELGDSDKGDTMSRMFAPSTPQDIWDMGAIQE